MYANAYGTININQYVLYEQPETIHFKWSFVTIQYRAVHATQIHTHRTVHVPCAYIYYFILYCNVKLRYINNSGKRELHSRTQSTDSLSKRTHAHTGTRLQYTIFCNYFCGLCKFSVCVRAMLFFLLLIFGWHLATEHANSISQKYVRFIIYVNI